MAKHNRHAAANPALPSPHYHVQYHEGVPAPGAVPYYHREVGDAELPPAAWARGTLVVPSMVADHYVPLTAAQWAGLGLTAVDGLVAS